MKKNQLITQLKNNWSRVAVIMQDPRTLFERIYDCFEVILELETGLIKGGIAELKRNSNEIRTVFNRLLDNKKFLDNLNQLKKFSPIENNTREDREVIIINERDFNTIINVIYTVRNNLRHGKKEYTPRSEKLLRVVNNIFYKIVGSARIKYLSLRPRNLD